MDGDHYTIKQHSSERIKNGWAAYGEDDELLVVGVTYGECLRALANLADTKCWDRKGGRNSGE